MKVKCIKKENSGMWDRMDAVKKFFFFTRKAKRIWHKGPKYDDVVTIANEYWKEGQKWYELLEWPNGCGYHSSYFLPVVTDEATEENKMKEVTFTKIKERIPALSEN